MVFYTYNRAPGCLMSGQFGESLISIMIKFMCLTELAVLRFCLGSRVNLLRS